MLTERGLKTDLEKVAKRAKHQKKIPEAKGPLTKYDIYLWVVVVVVVEDYRPIGFTPL